MRLDKLTVKSREAIGDADSLARRRHHQEVLPLHLLAALLKQEGGIAQPLLGRVGISADTLYNDVSKALDKLPRVDGAETYPGRELTNLIEEATIHASRAVWGAALKAASKSVRPSFSAFFLTSFRAALGPF